ncbi:MAG: hypothetical protein HFJ55_03475 [Clostridia bacterium]|nr:hypothetical protein [Clostridia bacterium]
MSIESDLRKDGIKVINILDTMSVNQISHNIAAKLCETFPELCFNEKDLYAKLSKLNMYRATMPDGMAEANYFYKNSSIYFNAKIENEDLEEFAIHECIHYIQEVKDKKNNLVRMGLCNFDNLKITGMGLNEAAVQYLTSKMIGIERDYVKYFGISFKTISPSYYPLECNIIEQMAYITGELVLFDSTFTSNDNFKNAFIEFTSEKVYNDIQYYIDKILELEENVIKLGNKFSAYDERTKKVDKIVAKTDNCKLKIADYFIKAQNLIIKNYFNKAFNKITNLEELDNFRRQLEHYGELIGRTDDYTFFDDFYTEMMSALEHKCNVLENGGIETALDDIKKPNVILSWIRALKNFVTGEKIHN